MFHSPGERQQVLRREDGLIADHVTDVALQEGRMIVATPAGLTFVDESGARSLYAFHGLVNNHVYALSLTGDRLLAGTLGGMSILDGSIVRTSFTTANSALKHNWITSIARVGEEWFVGTYGAGVLRLDTAGTWHSFPDATEAFEVNNNAMLVTRKHVYAGTLGRGLYVYDRETYRWTPVRSGLPSLNVTALAAQGGYIYVGTDNGVTRFPDRSGQDEHGT
jgi:ligand-binding sensor domain-containing protein